jgi:hypothetical protein
LREASEIERARKQDFNKKATLACKRAGNQSSQMSAKWRSLGKSESQRQSIGLPVFQAPILLLNNNANFGNWQTFMPRQPSAPFSKASRGSVPEVARCDTIEVGEAVVRAGSKVEAYDQVEQTTMGAICNLYGQRFLVKRFDIAADEAAQQAA